MKSNFYTRKRNLFDPKGKTPFRLSRSKIEDFLKCPRCFYLDRRLGIGHPSMPAFTLNTAVDELLKKEFDRYRREQKPHPLMERFGVEAVPFAHPSLKEWQENFKGIQHHHLKTNLVITGAIDDLWQGKGGELLIVDYKSTSTREAIDLDSAYKVAYKRQMEIYQWLFRQEGFSVSPTGYFVFCNADKDREGFDGRLVFDVEVISYRGDDSWVEGAIGRAHACLMDGRVPEPSGDCEYCQYCEAAAKANPKNPAPPKDQEEFLFS